MNQNSEVSSLQSNAADVSQPEKITILWLLHNVPIGMWITALGLFASSFVFGLNAARFPFVQQIFNLPVDKEMNGKTIKILQDKLDEKETELETQKTHILKNSHMPLEGIWEYNTHYKEYFGEKDSLTEPKKYAHGRAAFIWYGNKNTGQYHVLMGGGVYDGPSKTLIATHVIDSPLESDGAGNPIEGTSMSGRYLARTTFINRYESRSDQIIKLSDLHIEHYNDNEVKSMVFTININDNRKESIGTVVFTKPPPQ